MSVQADRRPMEGYQQGFVSQDQELEIAELPITGEIPAWLDGVLLRNGPSQFEIGQRQLHHWFDGLAMLHKFAFRDGRVAYANKFLRSPEYQHAQQHGKLGYSEFATDPCRSLFKRVATIFKPSFGYNANVSITKLAERFVAWTEAPIPLEFDPDTLATLGLIDFPDTFDCTISTPHPHIDPATGEWLNHSTKFGANSCYNLYRIKADGRRELIASLPAPDPAYMHSFSVTQSFIILTEYPLVVHPLQMLIGGKAFAHNLCWEPERGTKVYVIDKHKGELRGFFKTDPCFSFHHINAFEQAGEITLDLLAYADGSIIDSLYLNTLRGPHPDHPLFPISELRRYHISLPAGTIRAERINDAALELPRINYDRFHARPYRYVYGNALRPEQPLDFMNQLAKVDLITGETYTWWQDACYPGEPIYVDVPNATAEDDGVLLSVVLDAARHTSFLLVLDARTMQQIGRADVPQRIPFGFHGGYFGR